MRARREGGVSQGRHPKRVNEKKKGVQDSSICIIQRERKKGGLSPNSHLCTLKTAIQDGPEWLQQCTWSGRLALYQGRVRSKVRSHPLLCCSSSARVQANWLTELGSVADEVYALGAAMRPVDSENNERGKETSG